MRKQYTSKIMRTYGKTRKDLANFLGISESNVSYRHKAGLLRQFEIADPEESYKSIHPKIRQTFHNIKSRCNNPKDVAYSYYGAKGIKSLLTLEDLIYLWKRDRAETLSQASIDRIDSNGHYTIENCRFIEMSENRNKSNQNRAFRPWK